MKHSALSFRFFVRRLSFGLLSLSLSGPVWADKDTIKYRQRVYSAIGAQMGAISDVLRGKVPYKDDLPVLATGLARLSQLPPDLFPEGSDRGDTEALPVIWENYEEFMQLMSDMRTAANALAAADASDRRAFAGAFQNLGRTCKACHDKFKAE